MQYRVDVLAATPDRSSDVMDRGAITLRTVEMESGERRPKNVR